MGNIYTELKNNYKTYTIEDLLQDDFFLNSILNPTVESETFWTSLLLNKEIDGDVYLQAKKTVLDINSEGDNDVDDDKIDALWNRIENTNRKPRVKRVRLYGAVAMVASIVLAVLIFRLSPMNTGNELEELAMSNIEEMKQSGNIQLIMSDNKMDLAEDDVQVDYSVHGKLKIDEEILDNEDKGYNQLVVPYGKRSSIILSDGTRLWVNAGTHIIYPVKFAKNKREIFVNGEVYAEVAKEEKRPFVMKTKHLNVEVLGTTFNLRDYETDENQSVVLVSGEVRVQSGKRRKETLRPNQQFSANEQTQEVKNVQVADHIAWVKGFYMFKQESLGNVLEYLSRYYGVSITCTTDVYNMKCTGGLDLKDDMRRVLDGLSLSAPIKYEEKDGAYIFHTN